MTTATGYRARKEYWEQIAARQDARAAMAGGGGNGHPGRNGRRGHRHYRPDYGKIGRPRPLAQSLWPMATIIMAAIVLWGVGGTLAAADDQRGRSSYTSQDLLDMAEANSMGNSIGNSPITPAAPTISVAVGEAADGVTAPEGIADGSTPVTIADPMPELIEAPSITAPGFVTENATPTQPADIDARGQAALAAISYPWDQLLPGWTIEFLDETDGLYGLTLVSKKRIEIYVRDGQDTALLAHVIAHELGHAVDVTHNDGDDRRRWEQSRGIEDFPWWPGSGDTDFSTGAGDFAEAFAAWQVGDRSFRSTLANPPSAGQRALLAELSIG
jgi:hypothetical protein